MAHAFVNVVIPMDSVWADAVDDYLKTSTQQSQGNRPRQDIVRRVYEIGSIHFMTITVVRPGSPADGYPQPPDPALPAHLIVEVCADGGSEEVVEALAIALGPELHDILKAAHVQRPAEERLADFLLRHRIVIGDGWFSQAVGQVFAGSPGMSVRRINREEQLAARIGALIDKFRATPEWMYASPRERLEKVRNIVWEEDDSKWAFVPEPAPCLAGDPHNPWNSRFSVFNPQYLKAGWSIASKFLWPLWAGLLALAVAVVLKFVVMWDLYGLLGALRLGAICLGLVFVALAVALLLAYVRLRHLEETDRPDEIVPPKDQVSMLMKVENFAAQNHLASISRLKPGLLRKLTLRFAFIVVGTGRFVGAPGFLGKNGVIHFARWMRLPGTDQLLFWSNYDGTWESYVGDFIADAPSGVTAIWSNCIGFPRSQGLFGKGATNRDRLVNWARRQQHPTVFFYSAYRHLTAARIRINAAIRQGFASAQSDADARDWLALFGSAPMPADVVQTPEIPMLVFGGLSRLRHARARIATLKPDAKPEDRRAWLGVVARSAAYGEMVPGQRSAVVVGFSAGGLVALGLPPDALATFPVAFQQGMGEQSRARELGDIGESAPTWWEWGSQERPAHVLLMVYGATPEDLDVAEVKLLEPAVIAGSSTVTLAALPDRVQAAARAMTEHGRAAAPVEVRASESECGRAGAAGSGASAATCLDPRLHSDSTGASGHSYRQAMPLRMSTGRGPFPPEPFGFADGVSQPIIRGTPGWSKLAGGRRIVPPTDGSLPVEAAPSPIADRADDVVEPGEMILGYMDNIGTIPPSPSIAAEYDPHHLLADVGTNPLRRRPEMSRYEGKGRRDLGSNATFLVVRKLEQDVAGFDDWLEKSVDRLAQAAYIGQEGSRVSLLSAPLPPRRADIQAQVLAKGSADRERVKDAIAAKLVGRWKDGTSLVRYPKMPGSEQVPPASPDNDFLFGVEDPAGIGCPLGSHIRRANPRDARFRGEEREIATTNRHRILRVGRAYGPVGTTETGQGLLFMCVNADIARQFEFVQKSWLLNPNMHDLEDEVDPIVGHGTRIFTIATPTGPLRIPGPPDLVKVKAGEYFFLPGRSVLNYLANTCFAPSEVPMSVR